MDQNMRDALATHQERIEDLRSKSRELAARVKKSRARAHDRDDLIEVTVGQGGMLLDLDIHAEAYRRLKPDELAALIVETCGVATESLAERTALAYGSVFGVKVNPQDFATGDADFGDSVQRAIRHWFPRPEA